MLDSTLSDALAGRYRLDRELGAGGMATVYLAEDLRHHRQVAIKVLRPELSAALGPERFLREITTTANLRHPGILPLYDSGEAGSFLYYVMPYVEGESLRGRLERDKQLPIEKALRIADQVADALHYAHGRGVIHRDIKPENILLENGRAVVADFGIAHAVSASGTERLTSTGLSLGTPHYMSPEQSSGDLEAGVALVEEARRVQVRNGDYEGGGVGLSFLAQMVFARGDLPRALELYREAEVSLKTVGDIPEVARIQCEMGYVALAGSDVGLARVLFQQAVRSYDEVGSARGTGQALIGLAATEAAAGNPERAVTIAAAAEVLSERAGVVVAHPMAPDVAERIEALRATIPRKQLDDLISSGSALSPAAVLAMVAG